MALISFSKYKCLIKQSICSSHETPSSFNCFPTLMLGNSPPELVSSFKYSRSSHIHSVISKCRKTLGVIYHHLSHHTSSIVLLKLYLTLVLPYLTYCSSVWSPPFNSGACKKLEQVQHFALKICTQKWSADYPSLLSSLKLQSISMRHSQSILITVYKLINNLSYSPPNLLLPACIPLRPSRHSHSSDLNIPFCHTSASLNSFASSAPRLWNSLPPEVKSVSSLKLFKKTSKSTYNLLLTQI